MNDVLKKLKPTSFNDHREYLNAIYKELKKSKDSYSFTRFSDDIGLGPCNASYLLITGRRHLTEKTAKKIIKALKLKNEDRRFLLELAHVDHKKPSERGSKHVEKLINLRTHALEDEEDKKLLEFFGDYLHTIVLEILQMPNSKSDVDWIAAQVNPKVPASRVAESLTLLQRLGIIIFDPVTKIYVVQTPNIETPQKVMGLAFMSYHTQFIKLAMESVTRFHGRDRHITSVTGSVSSDTKQKLSQELERFRSKLVELIDEDKGGNEVVQVNLQLFPLTKKVE